MKYVIIFYFLLSWTFGFLQTAGVINAGLVNVDDLDGMPEISGLPEQYESGIPSESVGIEEMVSNTYQVTMQMATFSFSLAGENTEPGSPLGLINLFISGIFGLLTWFVWLGIVSKFLYAIPFFRA